MNVCVCVSEYSNMPGEILLLCYFRYSYLDLSQAELIAVIVDKEMVCVCDGTLVACLFVLP